MQTRSSATYLGVSLPVVRQFETGVERRSYSRAVLELAIVAVIVGLVALLLLQGAPTGGGPEPWSEAYCRQLLSKYEPTVATELLSESRTNDSFRLSGVFANGEKLVDMYGSGDKISVCSISITDSYTATLPNVYDCTLWTMNYNIENQTDRKMIATRLTPVEGLFGEDGGAATTTFTYYNPNAADANVEYEVLAGKLSLQSCDV